MDILFDAGGVLVKEGAFNQILDSMKIKKGYHDDLINKLWKTYINKDFWNGSMTINEMEALFKYLHNSNTWAQFDIDWDCFPAIKLELYNYTEKLLNNPLNSGNQYVLSNHRHEWLRPNLNRFEGKQIKKLFISSEIGCIKPDKEAFEYVIDWGIDPQNTLFIDDKQENLDVAKEFGFYTLLALNEIDLSYAIRTKLISIGDDKVQKLWDEKQVSK